MATHAPEEEDVRCFDQSDSSLPPLPSDTDESNFLQVHTEEGNDRSALMEREMKRQLMDIESSFLPEPEAPQAQGAAQQGAKGMDDTYIFGGSPDNGGIQAEAVTQGAEDVYHEGGSGDVHREDGSAEERAEEVALPESPPTPADAYKTPGPGRIQDQEDNEDESLDESRLEDMSSVGPTPSSPAAAAAHRSRSRAAAPGAEEGPFIEITPDDASDQHTVHNVQSSPQSHRPTSSASTVKAPLDEQEGSGKTEEASSSLNNTLSSSSSGERKSVRKRPSFLGARFGSHRSSTSSAGHSDYSNDNAETLGTDFALQSGGAVPTMSARHSMGDLSRLPSLGSIASSVSGYSEGNTPDLEHRRSFMGNSRRNHNGLEPLDEEPARSASPDPETPRPVTAGSAGPTDTIISKHVQDIQVPDTVAREYRERHARSPDKKSASNSFAFSSRTKHNLTLKEQNSKIDKLSKENFDLKLKIHFLDQALQNRSDEGVKEMISKNVQLQTDLATEKKESQSLRRKNRELERKLKAQEEGLAAARTTGGSDDAKSTTSSHRDEMQEEITYLRECLQSSEVEIEKLREESLAKEVDKRRMAEYVRSMGEQRRGSEPGTGVEETVEMWKELLETETARREQADEDAQRLREEVRRLKNETASFSSNHNIRSSQVIRRSRTSYARTESGGSDGTNEVNGATVSSSTTLVSSLQHEIAELRSHLGAQTSMLTSRNKERERLQQEIEELKLSQRRGGGSVAGDSIFDRSISRANQRPASRVSGATRVTELSDAERDEYENKQNALRDELLELKMNFQDVDRELLAHVDRNEQLEAENNELKEERDLMTEDLQALQVERDEALAVLQDKDQECEELREEALTKIEELEQQLEQKEQELDRVFNDLDNRNEDFAALQQEMKTVSESVMQLEDDRVASERRIQVLEQEIEGANNELDTLDQRLHEANQKIERYEVQAEGTQNEISFLREEQEGDKLKIGDLESALNDAQQSLQDEKERFRELEQRIAEERRQREALDSQEKQQVQKQFDELNSQGSKAKEEVRRLRHELSSKAVEATQWKERLDDLENNLREALGSLDGTKSSLLKDVNKLQRDLENTMMELDHARTMLAEKDSTIRTRDNLLRETALNTEYLRETLEKERRARQQEKRAFDQDRRTETASRSTVDSLTKRCLELETLTQKDKRRIQKLDTQLQDQITERHNLLLEVWNRLSHLCGGDWISRNGLIAGDLPTQEVLLRNFPGFSKNVQLALKTVESIISSFKTNIKRTESDLWREYQDLQHTLDKRILRLDRLEQSVMGTRRAESRPSFSRTESISSNATATELARVKSDNVRLRTELNIQRQSTRPSPDPAAGASSFPSPPRPSRSASQSSPNSHRNSIAASLLRHHSSSAVEAMQQPSQPQQQQPSHIPAAPLQPSEQRWIHRLKELERRLKAEREARLIDRSGARKRLEEGKAENEELRLMLEREKERRSFAGGSERGLGSPVEFENEFER
ncbi:hypothetical protein K490DRAFT_48844 [Saccharata proteae CBS 121410]|uniref:Anucleate primary sterigmata protein B n=1 Tax=Saccharata proteae CBS 121410 TaxID=1314787 RepID=A0A9P4HMV4_9PEZI|nr:hypothetical protein K490DRAFT_48844 [Saccharata proteae CBS 121410]